MIWHLLLTSVSLVAVLFLLFLLLRNNAVYDERSRICDAIFDGSGNWEWRLHIFRAGPSYDEMLWKFWRPMNSFFSPVNEWQKPV